MGNHDHADDKGREEEWWACPTYGGKTRVCRGRGLSTSRECVECDWSFTFPENSTRGNHNNTWHETDGVAISIEDTDVGREVSLHEYTQAGWNRRYTMPVGQAHKLNELFDEVFPDG